MGFALLEVPDGDAAKGSIEGDRCDEALVNRVLDVL
jgi:hypothetical protein